MISNQVVTLIIKAAIRRLGYEIHRIPPAPICSVKSRDGPAPSFESILEGSGTLPIKLHFGSGPRVLRGWINIDLSYVHFAEYLKYYTDKYYPPEIRGGPSDLVVFDVRQGPLPLPDDSVDVIFHEDFIEHLSQRSQVLFLAETRRILKPGAVHRVSTPNLLSSMRDYSALEGGFNGVYVQEWDRNGHLNVLTPQVLKEMAHLVGYSTVVLTARNGSASPLIPPEYRPDPNDRPEDGNIFADLIK